MTEKTIPMKDAEIYTTEDGLDTWCVVKYLPAATTLLSRYLTYKQ
jgi:hypothetical protein